MTHTVEPQTSLRSRAASRTATGPPDTAGGRPEDRANPARPVDVTPVAVGRPAGRPSRLLTAAPYAAAIWSVAYLALGFGWLRGAAGYPWPGGSDAQVSVMALLSQQAGSWLVTGLAALALVTALTSLALDRSGAAASTVRRVLAVVAACLALLLSVVVPDYRLLASIGYVPVLLISWPLGLLDGLKVGSVLTWPLANLYLLTAAGLAFAVVAVRQWRTAAGTCLRCGRRHRPTAHAAGGRVPLAGWERWAVGVAVAVPTGYALTRWAWALGIPLGVSRDLLDELGGRVWAGAGLATFGLAGAWLTVGLVRPWGERFPRWMLGLRGRRVPVAMAVVPATVVAVCVTSAGLMFIRIGLTGGIGEAFPGARSDVAAWLPEMFWPLWGLALALAAQGYRRRRVTCQSERMPARRGS